MHTTINQQSINAYIRGISMNNIIQHSKHNETGMTYGDMWLKNSVSHGCIGSPSLLWGRVVLSVILCSMFVVVSWLNMVRSSSIFIQHESYQQHDVACYNYKRQRSNNICLLNVCCCLVLLFVVGNIQWMLGVIWTCSRITSMIPTIVNVVVIVSTMLTVVLDVIIRENRGVPLGV